MIRVRVADFVVSDGTAVELPSAGVALFVGPNNAGKSQSLRDLLGLAATPQSYVGRAIINVSVQKEGSAEEFVEWVRKNIPAVRNAEGQEVRSVGEYGLRPLTGMERYWQTEKLQHIGSLFLYHADATSRLTAGNSVANINFSTESPTHPLQRAFVDGDLERQVREAGLAAFGETLSIDRYAGNAIPLRVGEAPPFVHDNGVPSPAYIKNLQQLSRLEDQGDGMRSYMGLLLHVLGGAHQITLVDEPEAFLHPPQARLLGQTLAQRTIGSQQLFMATHSVDVVQGVLESEAPVTIVRITRDGSVNRAAVLDPQQVKQLWSDPLLRYSNLLDGLFHDAVVLCEGDADCRYYSSVLDSVYGRMIEQVPSRRPQLLFSHCGGKARLASVTTSLRAISIPVVIVADFDILNDEELLERTVVALGGGFEPMRANFARLHGALTAEVKPVSKVALREALIAALDDLPADMVGKKDADGLRSIIRLESGWDRVKRSGVAGLPQGQAHESGVELLAQLKAVGLVVVPVGELERFVPSVGGHGPKWVTEVHRRGLHDDPANVAPRSFVCDVVEATGGPRPPLDQPHAVTE